MFVSFARKHESVLGSFALDRPLGKEETGKRRKYNRLFFKSEIQRKIPSQREIDIESQKIYGTPEN